MNKKINILAKRFYFMLLLVFAIGCGYSAESTLPPHLTKVAIPTFQNDTFYVELGNELTNQLRRKMRSESSLEVSLERDANCTLSGKVIRYEKIILREDPDDNVTEARIIVTAQVSFHDIKNKKYLFENKKVQGSWTYLAPHGENEAYARQHAVRDLAENIIKDVTYIW